MSLVINHNLMAMNTARNLNNTYDRLSTSVQRLSSGLRINSAADDAAGMAIRELMRADIATMQQGIRNAADAISMIQTADGAMAVIDEKLVRMKELAEQAATGTYTTLQREIINSEYQAMADEIDRIAASTNFNGVKLLDGSTSNLHGGQGMKIHFGVGNNPDEDYYFLTMGDVRATSNTGLRIGGDAKNDIWGQGAAGATGLAGPGCCTAGYDSLDGPGGFTSGDTFSYGYNWDWMEDDDPDLLTGKYLAGRYTVSSTDSLQDLIDKINKGTQSRVGVQLDASALAAAIKNGGTAAVCVGDEAYIFGSASIAGGTTVIPAVEGVTYRYIAEGNYLGAGFMANQVNGAAGYGFGLTSAQISALQKAGVDLTALGLTNAQVTASASSTVGSAQARTQLLLALTNAWNALGLSQYSAITTQSGVVQGFTITSANVKASATASNVSSQYLSATILQDGTVNVHTGVYADANGNWTDDERIAKALGLTEVVFHITNQDSPSYKADLNQDYKSSYYAMNGTGTIAYVGNATTLTTAGITGFASATVAAGLTATGANASAASAALLSLVSAAFFNKYSTVTKELTFQVSAAAGTSYGKAGSQIISSAGAANFTGGILNDNTTIQISANLWWDGNGNFTDSKETADALGFTRVVYSVARASTAYTISIVGVAGDINSDTAFSTLINAADSTDMATLAAALNVSYANQIAARQTAAAGDQGYVLLSDYDSSKLYPPKAEELVGKYSNTAQTASNYLTATVDIAGKTSAIGASYGVALTGLNRNTTTLGELVDPIATALSQILELYQNNALTKNLVSMGRLVTEKATPPQGPNSVAEVDKFTASTAFNTGTLDKSVATGIYDDSGYVFNATTGYGLTSVQLKAIQVTGLDLSKLNLQSAIINTSATSNVSSASARALLLQKITNLWNALALGDYSALTVSGGLFTGYTTIESAAVKASAGAAISATAGGNIIKEQKTMVVHTGIYADANGNWTDDAALAKDLGLSEITYTVSNNNNTWYSTSAHWVSNDYAVNGNFLATSTTLADLSTASAAFATFLNSFTSASISARGSAANAAAASADLLTQALANWAAKYQNAHSSLVFDAADNGSTILAPAFSFIGQSANAANTTANGPTGEIRVGSTLVVHTGIYSDSAGNWTDNKEVADAFGLNEITYSILNNGTNYLVSGAGVAANTPIAISELGDLATPVMTYIRTFLGGKLATAGKISLTAQAGPAAPTKADLDGVKTAIKSDTVNTVDPSRTGFLDVQIDIAGVTKSVFDLWTPPSLASNINMTDLADKLNTNVGESLSWLALQVSGTYTGMGKVNAIAPTPPGPPSSLADLTKFTEEDIYKSASNAQTVTTTGIIDKTKHVTVVASAGTAYFNDQGISNFGAWALASAINHNPNSQFWAMVQSVNSDGVSADMVYIFTKDGGDYNSLLACDVADGDVASREALDAISFENTETDVHSQSGTNFSLGGQNWATMKPVQTRAGQGKEVWNLTLHGRDVGKERDLWIAAVTNGQNEVQTPGLSGNIINGLDRYSFVEIQNADNGQWTGAEVRTQSSAQEALDRINDAMARKDKVRADIGALQNRLENTITNLEIQVEALQQSESRISDVDMATEMTEFVRNQVLAQAAISMLTQANSLPQMALSLLNG
jgi:flagellin-like hook-associated protein FlgL